MSPGLSRRRGMHALRVALAVALAHLTGPVGADAQVDFSVLAGFGTTAWEGPWVQADKSSFTAAAAIEWRALGALALRGEAGGTGVRADMGRTGTFSEETTLSHGRVGLAGLVRAYAFERAGHGAFLEAGLRRWRRTVCDIDLVGGPGFFGGETVDCLGWAPDGVTTDGLYPASSGSDGLLGVGGYRGRWGATLRYQTAGSALILTNGGVLKASAVTLSVDWAFTRGP